MREKMLAVAQKLRDLSAEDGVDTLTPGNLLWAIAERIEEELSAPAVVFTCPHCPTNHESSVALDSHIYIIHGIKRVSQL